MVLVDEGFVNGGAHRPAGGSVRDDQEGSITGSGALVDPILLRARRASCSVFDESTNPDPAAGQRRRSPSPSASTGFPKTETAILVVSVNFEAPACDWPRPPRRGGSMPTACSALASSSRRSVGDIDELPRWSTIQHDWPVSRRAMATSAMTFGLPIRLGRHPPRTYATAWTAAARSKRKPGVCRYRAVTTSRPARPSATRSSRSPPPRSGIRERVSGTSRTRELVLPERCISEGIDVVLDEVVIGWRLTRTPLVAPGHGIRPRRPGGSTPAGRRGCATRLSWHRLHPARPGREELHRPAVGEPRPQLCAQVTEELA